MLQRLSLVALVGGFAALAQAQPPQIQHAQNQTNQSVAQSAIDAVIGQARSSRAKARELKAQSDRLAANGDTNGAMDVRLQMLDFDSAKLSNLSALTFYAIQDLALDDISGIAAHLDAASSRKYAAQLLEIDGRLFSITDLLKHQKAENAKQLKGISISPPAWKRAIAGLGFNEKDRATLNQTPVAQIQSNIERFYDLSLALAAQPYLAQPRPLDFDLDPYSLNFVVPHVARRFLWARAKTERLLLVAALQDRADRLEKAATPSPLPPDPFGSGPVRAKDGAIYSVGPDTTDDGGKPVPNPKRLLPADKGDVLAPLF